MCNSVHRSPVSVLKLESRYAFKDVCNIAVLITTYKRPMLLEMLLVALREEADNYKITCYIYDDEITHNGKKGYWKTITHLWQEVRKSSYDYYFHLPDDVKLCESFLRKSILLWKAIDHPRKICLNLFIDDFRLGKIGWVNQWPAICHLNGQRYLHTQWVDMLFICERDFFDKLDWQIHPISPRRWDKRPTLSSGVGAQISRRLGNNGAELFQVTASMVEHLGNKSKMNPEIRNREVLKAFNLPLMIGAYYFEGANRGMLQESINSVLDSVDKIFVAQRDQPAKTDWFFDHPKVQALESTTGECEEFVELIRKVVSDDFYFFPLQRFYRYSSEYFWTGVRAVENYGRRTIIEINIMPFDISKGQIGGCSPSEYNRVWFESGENCTASTGNL